MSVVNPALDLRATESALVERVQKGDVEALSRLIEIHRAGIISVATTILRDSNEAEDVVQDSFLRAYQRIHHIRSDCSFKNYLYRIATRQCLDRLRKRRSCLVSEIREEAQLPVDVDSKICVEKALEMLNPQMRTILLLREIHDFDYNEIADMLKIPVGTVRSRLHFARERFRKVWIQEVGLEC
ncbi:MAG: sigma-70 family RNA polymerase sigma factor [Armatimonadetes bacterium]|nr:sigma-70 family RNA polymerase sigma factor [Armatimonadota bacterium]MBS1702003.1 sigma-70 family RNA polymerase sigma factor [Armatimonadota bacterium]MBS1728156.1 sigma-70 family RNA polymerase sigma factor [Armatimonadota bacterium]